MIQTGDGSSLTGESGPNPYAIGAIIATLVAAVGATFVVRVAPRGILT